MSVIAQQSNKLSLEISKALSDIGIDELNARLSELRENAKSADFWQDNLAAQENLKEQSRINDKVEPWQRLSKEIGEICELAALDDKTLEVDLNKQLEHVHKTFNDLKGQLKFRGAYDEHDAILSIYAGAGGTDAQDWAQMLQRMYTRWAEKSSLKVKMVDESAGEEAGIKSATFEIIGLYVYGKLKGEHGVHRLVRLSPFNADNLRQTSFARVEVVPKIDKPGDIEIDDKDLKIDVFRAGGHGGQSVNTTDSAVRITHLPTGTVVSCQDEKSQQQNKAKAFKILRSRILASEQERLNKERRETRKSQIGSGDRSEKIRTYNFPQDRVTDHRIKQSFHNIEGIMAGEIQPIIEAIKKSEK